MPRPNGAPKEPTQGRSGVVAKRSKAASIARPTRLKGSEKQRALHHFKRVDPVFFAATKAHHASLPDTLSRRKGAAALFAALCSTVVSQQLGRKAAESIYARLKEACNGSVTPEALLHLPVTRLRAVGLSAAKAKTLLAIASAVADGTLALHTYHKIPEESVSEAMQAIWGLGPWSVDMFMMFSLGRADVFSPGDLGLVRGIELVYGLPKGISRTEALERAAPWAPYRTYASMLLWRTRDAVPPIDTKEGSDTRRVSQPASKRQRSRSSRRGTGGVS